MNVAYGPVELKKFLGEAARVSQVSKDTDWLSKKGLLFLWLAHLNNKSNVCKQIIESRCISAVARFFLFSYIFHHTKSTLVVLTGPSRCHDKVH